MKRQWDFLKKSFELGKISHAYIFSGNDAQEKNEVLLNLVKFINPKSAIELEAMNENRYPDVRVVKSEKQEITIAEIRELALFASLGAWSSLYKIVIFYNAEKANQEAQSALLKLLEEPKGDTIFFLLTEYAFLLLPTIRSRAQQIEFWHFAPLGEHEKNDSSAAEFKTLMGQPLAERFKYARELAESDKGIEDVLKKWITCLRVLLLAHLKENPANVSSEAKAVALVQEVLYLIQHTNVNKRLALERIMIEL